MPPAVFSILQGQRYAGGRRGSSPATQAFATLQVG